MHRLSWLAALVGALSGVLAVFTIAPAACGQDEPQVEVISEPPPQVEPQPGESPAPESPPAAPAESPPSEAPREEPPPKPEPPKQPPGHLRVGGGLGFGIGADFISVGVAPQVSYIFKRIVEPGVSVRYQYARDRVSVPNVIWHTYGGSIFTRLFPIPQLFFLIEGEVINTGWTTGGVSSGRRTYGNLLLGGGFMMGVGRGAFFGTSLKFAVFRNPFYPDAFPIISVGGGYAF